MAGHPTYHVNVIKIKVGGYIDRRVAAATGPPPPHPHVNRPLETLRFQDEGDYENEILIKVLFPRILKKHPEKLHFTFFSLEKVSRLSSFIESV